MQYYDGTADTESYLDPVIEFAESRQRNLQEMMLHIAYVKGFAFQEEKEVRIAVAGQSQPLHSSSLRTRSADQAAVGPRVDPISGYRARRPSRHALAVLENVLRQRELQAGFDW